MKIKARIAIAINDEKQVRIELVARMIFQENGKSLQLEFSGIEAQKQEKCTKGKGFKTQSWKKRKNPRQTLMEEKLKLKNKVDVQNNILHTLREASYVGKKTILWTYHFKPPPPL